MKVIKESPSNFDYSNLDKLNKIKDKSEYNLSEFNNHAISRLKTLSNELKKVCNYIDNNYPKKKTLFDKTSASYDFIEAYRNNLIKSSHTKFVLPKYSNGDIEIRFENYSDYASGGYESVKKKSFPYFIYSTENGLEGMSPIYSEWVKKNPKINEFIKTSIDWPIDNAYEVLDNMLKSWYQLDIPDEEEIIDTEVDEQMLAR